MSGDIFFVKLNLDDLGKEVLALEDDQERSAWLLGFQIGASGAPPRDSWSDQKRAGWSFGVRAREDALRSMEKVVRAGRASVEARRQKNGTAQPNKQSIAARTPLERRSEHRSEQSAEHSPNQLSAISYQLPTNNEEQQLPPQSPQGGKRAPRFVPPTEEEWVAYCTETWPDWHPTCAAEVWAYYEGVGWKMRAGPVKDWKAAAKTSHGNARQWGKLQPSTTPAGRGRCAPSSRAFADQQYIDLNLRGGSNAAHLASSAPLHDPRFDDLE